MGPGTSGPGTSSNEDAGFIVRAVTNGRASSSNSCAIRAFLLHGRESRSAFLCCFLFLRCFDQTWVRVPAGAGREGYALNIGSIWRGVEGHWFRARDDWNATASPFIFPLSDSSLRPFSTCDAHEFPAHLTTTDPAYSDALTLERELTANGVAVQCIAGSKMQSFFQGQKGAAWFHTAYGVFDALFFRNSDAPRAIQVTEQRNGARFLYSFPGTGLAPQMDSSKPESFVRVANALLCCMGETNSLHQSSTQSFANQIRTVNRRQLAPELNRPVPEKRCRFNRSMQHHLS